MSSHKCVVAIVDDDSQLLVSLGDFLESVGYSVRAFTSGRDFLDDDRFSAVDCLITDITMPELDGFELQDAANAKRPSLPVIFITGTNDVTTYARVRALPEGRFFRKPFDAKNLATAISRAISPNQ